MTNKYRKYVKRICEQCGDEYSVRADHKTSKYCSRKCAGKSRRKGKIECEYCSKKFIPARKTTRFCSNKCKGKYMRKQVKIKCSNCGKIFSRVECHVVDNNFCSRECYGNWMSQNLKGENAIRWNGGIYDNGQYIFIRQDDGSYKQEHRIVMEEHLGRELLEHEVVHHIDGDGKNNEVKNLEVMSRAEHGKLHTQERWDEIGIEDFGG